MQSGDDRDVDAFISQYLLRQKSYRGMRYGIMDMEQIQLFILDDIDQLTGQRSVIWGIIKQWVLLCIHFMEKNIFLEMVKSDRALIRDKMNLMTFGGQGQAKFSCYYTGTTVGRVTHYSYTHISVEN